MMAMMMMMMAMMVMMMAMMMTMVSLFNKPPGPHIGHISENLIIPNQPHHIYISSLIDLILRAPRLLIPLLVKVVTVVWFNCELVIRPGLSCQMEEE